MLALRANSAEPQGAERAAAVAPHSETTGHPTAAAMCIGPESGPQATSHSAKIPAKSSRRVAPVRSSRGTSRSSRRTASARASSSRPPIRIGKNPRAPLRRAARSLITAAIDSGK